MEENENKNNSSNFKAVPNSANSKKIYTEKKAKTGIGKTVILPFFSGIVGCVVVMGTIFGVPEIKNKLFNSEQSPFSLSQNNTTRI